MKNSGNSARYPAGRGGAPRKWTALLLTAALALLCGCAGETPAAPADGQEDSPGVVPPRETGAGTNPGGESVWTLCFDETFETTVTNEGIPLTVEVSVSLTAEKQGGDTALGSYTGVFSGDADLDRDSFLKAMNESPEIRDSGGRLTDYTENDLGISQAALTLEVEPMDDDAYHQVLVGHIPEGERTATEQLPVPISSLFPDAMMALGEISGMLTISGTMTMEVAGSSFTLPFGTEAGAAQPFAVCIYPDGAARLTFPLMSRDGFARDWVEGTLTRQPLP